MTTETQAVDVAGLKAALGEAEAQACEAAAAAAGAEAKALTPPT